MIRLSPVTAWLLVVLARPFGIVLELPLTSAQEARKRLRWVIRHDRVMAPTGRWHRLPDRVDVWRNPHWRLKDLSNPNGYFLGRPLSIPSVMADFQRWLKPRYAWRWRR